MASRAELADQSVEPRATDSHFWARVGPGPNQEISNTFPAGFPNGYGAEAPVHFLFCSFLNKRSVRSSYATSMEGVCLWVTGLQIAGNSIRAELKKQYHLFFFFCFRMLHFESILMQQLITNTHCMLILHQKDKNC